ncbi:uncharacterized protein K452DRAFT_143789 [Aplosporella prunicola CBS 121167]|uniref:Uncharacterized protein n=1 Tax=Aplosporella prunicola CBS 121167 TaxID=1176127 RepID=A0A6A6BPS8_9PEZI|nr:uncharacterized protein K452DRAFT_143789 [Aplosporella prunicola CBS 121167]KAF2144571.1 hypothetical protein K452DRAFT_143789 [Aplosporella prunicola CBS 121167]
MHSVAISSTWVIRFLGPSVCRNPSTTLVSSFYSSSLFFSSPLPFLNFELFEGVLFMEGVLFAFFNTVSGDVHTPDFCTGIHPVCLTVSIGVLIMLCLLYIRPQWLRRT